MSILRTSYYFDDSFIKQVDKFVFKMKQNSWKNASRSSFARACMKAIMESEVDMKGVKSEDELINRLVSNR